MTNLLTEVVIMPLIYILEITRTQVLDLNIDQADQAWQNNQPNTFTKQPRKHIIQGVE